MTCKDCVHYELCFDYTHLKHSKSLPDNREDVCEHFKNKANFVELPLKIGDKFYTKYGYSATVESIRLFPDGDIVFCGGNKGTKDYIPFHSKEIGEYAFLTKEEAEQKLKGGMQE